MQVHFFYFSIQIMILTDSNNFLMIICAKKKFWSNKLSKGTSFDMGP